MSASESKTPVAPTQDVPIGLGSAAVLDQSEIFSVAIKGILEEFDVQPILFIGAGIARRYIDAPDWTGALRFALEKLGSVSPPYSYFM